jgi:hypothetical protein
MQTLQNPLYTKTPLPPVTPEAIHILFNITNELQIKNEVILAKSIKNYTKHEPTILGLKQSKTFGYQKRQQILSANGPSNPKHSGQDQNGHK